MKVVSFGLRLLSDTLLHVQPTGPRHVNNNVNKRTLAQRTSVVERGVFVWDQIALVFINSRPSTGIFVDSSLLY